MERECLDDSEIHYSQSRSSEEKWIDPPNQISKEMSDSKVELTVQPYDIVSSDKDSCAQIRLWTHDRDSNRVLIRVEDYQPYIRLELPSFVDGRYVKWSIDALKVYAQWLKIVLEGHAPVKMVYSELERLYLYRERVKFPFFTCYFNSEEAVKHCTQLINKKPYSINQLGTIKARVWETTISTVHRLVTDLNIGYGQWLKIQAEEVPDIDRISSNPREYIASYKDIVGMKEQDTKGWITRPLCGAVDIECYSSNHRAMPNRLYVEDCVFMISYITQRLGDPSTKMKYLLVLGDCPPIPGAEIRKYNNELALIDGLSDLINETDPSLIVGYNTYKFDYPYLDARIKTCLRDWKKCGLLLDEQTYVNTKSWKSSAYGFMNISTLETEGRLSIDMFPIIKRDHKLDRYTLDFVSRHFLDRGKHDVSAAQMFQYYKEYMDCVSELRRNQVPQELWNDRQPQDPQVSSQIEHYPEWVASLPEITQPLFQGLPSDLPSEILNLLKRYAIVMAELYKIGDYNLEDSCLCIDLMEKLNTWIALIELSSIVAVTVMSIFTRGQQLRVQNQVYQYAYRDGFVIDERAGGKKFTGAHVVDPIPGKYKNILIFDFASLYPSIIRAFNICFTTLVPDDSPITDDKCHILAWEETDKKGVVTRHRYRFIKQEYFHGILPRMCEHLTNARSAVRKQMGPQNDLVTNIVLDQRQGGLKISNNSVFGALGVTDGRLPLPEGACCITAMGRFLSGTAADHVKEKHHGNIVYGDTDSIMVDMGIEDPHQCKIIGEALSEEISALFPRPLKMEFERALAVALFIKKKKYAGVKMATIEKNDNPRRGPLIVVHSVDLVEAHPNYKNPNYNLWKIVYTETIHDKSKNKTSYISIPQSVIVTLEQAYFSGTPLLAEDVKDDNGRVIETRLGAPDEKSMLKKGIVLARRDNCIWLKKVYIKVLQHILDDKPMTETMGLIDDEIIRMMSRSVPFLQMSVTREIGSNYKPGSTYFLSVFANELRRIGHPVQGGDRIDYVYVRCSDPVRNEKQGYKMKLHEHFWQNCYNEPLDCLHYVEKILGNPIDQIFYLGYKTQIDQIMARCAPQVRRRGKVYTYITDKYVKNNWTKLLKLKEDLVTTIKTQRPHFTSQSAYLLASHAIQPTLEVVG